MRGIGWLLLLLLTVGWLAAVVRLPSEPEPPPVEVAWRRTRDGWQRAYWLTTNPRHVDSIHRPALHPGVIGGLELMVSIMALVAFGPRHPRRSLNAQPRARPRLVHASSAGSLKK